MRFPDRSGCLSSVTLSVPSLTGSMSFWRGVLHPLGYGRINEWPGFVLWARDGAQLLLQEANEPSSRVVIMLRADSRDLVDAIHATACAQGWPIDEPPQSKLIAPGYYGCILAVPGAESIQLAIAHAWDDLPDWDDATRVRIASADAGVMLGGYLFRPSIEARGGFIVLHGYGSDATKTAPTGVRLAADGWITLCLSQRGWLGSTGNEDQGLRQPDDVIFAAKWLRRETGVAPIGLLGFSQGGQVALLAATRAQTFQCLVAYFPCTDLARWPQQVKGCGIQHYIEDFVAPENIACCSPLNVADRIRTPTLIVHGDRDTVVPFAQSEAMVAANPTIQLLRVPGGTHGLWAQSDELWPEVQAFINAHMPSAC